MTVLREYLKHTREVREEYQKIPLKKLSGEIPKGLTGFLFHNGNGKHQHHGTSYDHVFDGDGMITKFQFAKGDVLYSNSYVKTREFVEEEKAGKLLYRNFGTNLPGGWKKNFGKLSFKNASNTNLIYQGGKMLSLWEGGLPHLIDPESLSTISRYDFNGTLRNNFGWIDRKMQPELPFSAHPKYIHSKNKLYNFGTAPGGIPRLILYELDNEGNCRIDQVIKLQKLSFTHDFVVTNSGKKVFFLTPVSFNIWKTLLGKQSPVQSLSFEMNKNTTILVVDQQHTKKLTADFCFIFHFLNTYEEESGKIIVDALKMAKFPDADLNKELLQGNDQVNLLATPTRYILDPESGDVKQEKLFDIGMELPAVHPKLRGKKYRYAYGIGATKQKPHTLLQEIVKLDLEKKSYQSIDFPACIVGEPLFVPNPNGKEEDDGWLIFIRFEANTQSTLLAIAKANDFQILYEGQLPHNIPIGFHGTWVEKIY